MDVSEELIPTRWSLLSRLKDAGDAESWQEFFDTYWRLIYRAATKSGLTDAEAQEVVQEVVIGVARKMPEFRCDPAAGSFKGWLLTVTHRRIVDQFRKRQAWSPTQSPRGTDSPRWDIALAGRQRHGAHVHHRAGAGPGELRSRSRLGG